MNFALTLDHTKKQWVDLGIHTEACMTRPETCGAAGGAISVWVKIRDCHGQGELSRHKRMRHPEHCCSVLITCYGITQLFQRSRTDKNLMNSESDPLLLY